MKTKIKTKKLALARTTLRVLGSGDLDGVAGGTTIILTVATTTTFSLALGCSRACYDGGDTRGFQGR